VAEFLADHPRVHLRYTPTYSSWLNQVEVWFSKIERDLIHRGGFTSAKDLARRILKSNRHHNKDPRLIQWK
jgi:transposase